MKKAIYFLVVIFITYSCKKNTENLKLQISKKTIEKNLEKDINEYFQSLIDGNTEKAFNYLHKSNIVFLKKEFPDEYNDDVPKQSIRMASKQFAMFKDSLKAKLEFKVEKLDEKVNNQDYIIYLCKSKLIVSKKNQKDTIKDDTYLLGISENSGKNFKFLQADDKEYLKKTMKYSFDNDIIKKVSE